jgi:RNA polymerase sigma-70 factor, ECF subfamily
MVLQSPEREVIESCQRGEREGFRVLFEAYKDRVYSIALRFTGDRSAALDIAQDTFLKLFPAIRDFRAEASFESWIYRMVVNCCLDHKRRSRRMVPVEDGMLTSLRAPGDSLSEMLRSERDGRVRSAVDRLSPDLRIAIVLRYTEGLSYEQIAEVLGCSQGTVASRLNRAHKALERRLAHLVKEVGDGRA